MVKKIGYDYEVIPCEVAGGKVHVEVDMGTDLVTAPIPKVYGDLETKKADKITYSVGAWVPAESETKEGVMVKKGGR